MSLAVAVLVAISGSTMVSQPSDEGPDLIAKAMAATCEHIPAAESDPSRPQFHFRAPALWMNDPNGPIYTEGWYHVFYQFNPYGDQWGDMHWGHARSRDLVNWEHLPIALWPSKSLGEDHVYSGSTHMDSSGRPKIFYTSIGARNPEQWIATPTDDDLITWAKPQVNPVVSFKTNAPTVIDEWRDPFLFEEDGKTYMVTGGRQNGHGVVVAYQATNPELTEWRYLGILFRHPDSNLVECPNLAKFGSRWLLLTSHDGRVDWFSGSIDLHSMRFASANRGVMAEGSYASQLLKDKHGRCVHLAWVPTSEHRGWNGFMTLPSVLTLDTSGAPSRKPIEEFAKLRGKKVELTGLEVNGELDLADRIAGDLLELTIDIAPGSATSIGIRLFVSTDGKRSFDLSYDVQTHTLRTPGRTPVVLESGGDLKLHLFLDRSVVDVYTDGGATTQVATHTYQPDDTGIRIKAEGGKARLKSLAAYTLKPATFDLARFM